MEKKIGFNASKNSDTGRCVLVLFPVDVVHTKTQLLKNCRDI